MTRILKAFHFHTKRAGDGAQTEPQMASGKVFDFTGKKRWFFLGSTIIILAGIISLAIPGGVRLGIEFQGGTTFTIARSETVSLSDIEGKLTELGYGKIVAQQGGEYYYIRAPLMTPGEQQNLKDELENPEGLGLTVTGTDFVSPMVAKETLRNAGIAVVVANIAMLLYLIWAFRKVPHGLRWGICAIVSLIHDVLVMLGVFSWMTRASGWEIEPMFVTAVLAIIGYSINDTIVVFDRIRENLHIKLNLDFDTVVNTSLYQTLTRSLNTSLTTILAVLAVYLFIGGAIRSFALILLVGIASGTYSSILAAEMLVVWENEGWRGFLPQHAFAGRRTRLQAR